MRAWTCFARWAVYSPVVWVLVAVNLGSAVPGYLFWYGGTLQRSPWYLWVFVPDSPLSVSLMGVALVALHYRKRWEVLYMLASVSCMKYGMWTVLVWLTHYLSGGSYDFTAILMSATHGGMVIEGFIVAVLMRRVLLSLVVSACYLVVNDVVDYVLGHHPRVPNPQDLPLIGILTALLSVLIIVGWVVVLVKQGALHRQSALMGK
ncbi:MAG: DUF1405 domain-containing protein [Thermoleophilia bacterium]|nr:DUF1405 domain-containing protein [Thermoleophilia bacterium]